MNEFRFLPYTHRDGMPTMRTSTIKAIYDKCIESGLGEIIFDDQSINDADDFINHVTDFHTLFWVIFYGPDMVGFFYLNRLERTHAYCHFAAFPEIWGAGLAERAGREAMDIALESFSTIMGMVRADNEHAIDYLHRVGLKEVGDVPHLLYSKEAQGSVTGKLMYITREALNESLHKNSN